MSARKGRRPPQIEGQVTREITDVAHALVEASAARRAQAEERESRLVAEARKVDLVAVVRQAIEATMPGVEARGQRFVAELAPQPVWVDGDFARLLQVVANLLDNAIKFTPPGGRIDLTLARVEGDAVLSVSDTGRGIDPAFLPSLYTPFRQGEDTTHRVEGGLGLGLALARTLVELHGGSLSARSDGVDRGSTFVVRLACIVDTQARQPSTQGLAVGSTR
jgi:signal transduction histidine kinase